MITIINNLPPAAPGLNEKVFVIVSLCVSNLQLDDDSGGGGGLEETEEDYDALNCETFGSAINGDWEDIHETLVRMDRSTDIKDDHGESDLGKCRRNGKKFGIN